MYSRVGLENQRNNLLSALCIYCLIQHGTRKAGFWAWVSAVLLEITLNFKIIEKKSIYFYNVYIIRRPYRGAIHIHNSHKNLKVFSVFHDKVTHSHLLYIYTLGNRDLAQLS